MKFNRVVLASLMVACCAASISNGRKGGVVIGPYSEGDVNSNTVDKRSNKINIEKITDKDNKPSSASIRKPLVATESNLGVDESTSLWGKLIMPISMIVVSEIGDKTFLIAALMAMKHSRFVVFTSAFSSLAIMTILSGLIGHAVPTLLSQRVTQFLASILFAIFGYKLLKEGLAMPKELGVDEEMAEVEEELASSKLNSSMDDIELGNKSSTSMSPKPWYVELGNNVENLASFVLSPVWIQVFVMTFLGEWGDRSQIAIIAMAGVPDYWMIIFGAVIGHGICTFAATLGGKLLAKRISLRNVTLGGATAFVIFSVIYFYEALYELET